ncbi:MAG TPA: hypothetical protein VJ044_12860, partial [Candidatus Hodarchaeales archaeon]|nr:hypothetical protein [Candidatus Hodarchaeales archaeon]
MTDQTTGNVVVDDFKTTSFFGSFFRARLHIGYIAYPYLIFGFLVHWSLLGFQPEELSKSAWWRFSLGSLIAFLYTPFIFIVNDYFDAPYDALDKKKR